MIRPVVSLPQLDAVDPLSDILQKLRLTSSFFSRATLRRPYAVEARGLGGTAIFHVIVAGSGAVTLKDGESRRFTAGDIIVLPHGDAHVMAHEPATQGVPLASLPRPPCDDGLPTVTQGGGGEVTSIVCGSFAVDAHYRDALFPLLPRLLVRTGDATTAGWLDTTLRLMTREVRGAGPGSDVVLTRLADIVVVQVLRAVVADPPPGTRGWLVALRDPALARALVLLHGSPAARWTATTLARKVGMSRSAFFQRFAELMGEPPASYLGRFRMMLACDALSQRSATISDVAARVGYASDAAFSKAFKRHVGSSPADYRLHASDAADA
ncbi:MAG: AraC family transcriptional regulator [Myxococcales bacterium]|nr:AraC family transcriptional regulator [Myxococcales bacterium]